MATHISLALVFVEGLVSFLSPCVLPIIPIYMGYLAGNSNEKRNDTNPSTKTNARLICVSILTFNHC